MRMASSVVSLALLALTAPFAVAQEVDSKSTRSDREAFAAQVIGTNMAFFEGQRAGEAPSDAGMFPHVWETAGGWKKPAFRDMCSSYTNTLPASDATDISTYGGYFEAGTAVTVTGVMAWTATQRAIGALQFIADMAQATPTGGPIRDPAGCVAGSSSRKTLKELYLREMRYTAESLVAAILLARDDDSDFKILLGVADSTTFNYRPTWSALDSYQQKCYIGDMNNPAADIAAQVAAALALSAKVARDHGTAADIAAAARWEERALRAFNYAKGRYDIFDGAATCGKSSALTNCQGSGCSGGRGTCALYANTKNARQQLFVAAAALQYASTASSAQKREYRSLADEYWNDGWEPFYNNWNNVAPQGIMLLAMADDVSTARRRRDFYREKLRKGVKDWETCSNDGQTAFGDGKVFCRRTEDGAAFPLDIPQGQLGQALNGVCMAAVATKLGVLNSAAERDSHCFMQRQLGYMFNHKCADTSENSGAACNTGDSEGFAYMVGVGKHFPTKLHSRDAATPNWGKDDTNDGNTLCGATVTGPYATASSSASNYDKYDNKRNPFQESEPGIDFSGSMICALMGYAALEEESFSSCSARTPFTGRNVVSGNPPAGEEPPLPPLRGDDDVEEPPAECGELWTQCGGVNWTGTECCVEGAVCVRQNQYYSMCDRPAPTATPPTPPPPPPPPANPDPPTPPPSDAPPAEQPPAGVWQQCGGRGFTGPTTCEEGLECDIQGEWYHQCIPFVDED